MFLSNGTLLDQMTKTLLRKRWLFLDEMLTKPNCFVRSKDIHETEKEGWNADRRLLWNSPDPRVPIWETSGAKVIEWICSNDPFLIMRTYITLFRSGPIETTLVRSPIETKKYRPACHPHQNK
ncbi:hypothetical protein Ahy_B04g073752 [Arachis hypogaea]|uniref:Uncharacterized protein n=1 Tax=Arachis hypogaea TaxID=3818 RepID=A0A444ZR89_ARAHY|nr:hypothetical protein Ahy_B04g073752 [Arachis hypogaea]